jgi:hypothetical protein
LQKYVFIYLQKVYIDVSRGTSKKGLNIHAVDESTVIKARNSVWQKVYNHLQKYTLQQFHVCSMSCPYF